MRALRDTEFRGKVKQNTLAKYTRKGYAVIVRG